MKLRERWSFGAGGKTVSIHDAVVKCLDGRDQDRGSVETANATADACAVMMAELVEILHSNGHLSPDQVGALVGAHFEVFE